jgi:hypothetical protein
MMNGRFAEAGLFLEEAAALFQQMRDRPFYTASRSERGHLWRRQERWREAAALYRETIQDWQELGQRAAIAHELECFGFIAGAQGQAGRAATLLGAAEALRAANGTPMTQMERGEYDQAVAQLRTQLAGADFEAAWAAGRAMSQDVAVAYALEPTFPDVNS